MNDKLLWGSYSEKRRIREVLRNIKVGNLLVAFYHFLNANSCSHKLYRLFLRENSL